MRRLLGLVVITVGLAPGAASAATTCAFSPDTGVVSFSVPTGGTTVTRGGSGSGANDPILVGGAACGGATVRSTDTIVIADSGPYRVPRLDLGNGPLVPGRTDEPGGSDEIEIVLASVYVHTTITVVGTPADDHIVAGADGVNLNPDESDGVDADVYPDEPPLDIDQLSLEGAGGDDVLEARGGAGTGNAFRTTARFDGGEGDDVLDGIGSFDGGPGDDSITSRGGYGLALGGPGEDEIIGPLISADGGPGADHIEGGVGGSLGLYIPDAPQSVDVDLTSGVMARDGYGDTDTLGPGIRSVLSGPGDDHIVAGDRGLHVQSGDGADVVVTGPDQDSIYAGPGDDTVSSGGGADTVYDGPGDDQVSTGEGDDLLVLGGGTDHYAAGPDRDQLAMFSALPWVTIDLAARTVAYGDEPSGSVAGVEVVFIDRSALGTDTGDAIYGDDGPNVILADGAHVVGRGGDDSLSGRVDYGDATGPVTGTGGAVCTVTGGGVGRDEVVQSGSRILGSPYADRFNGCNRVDGRGGDDDIVGTGDADRLAGGAGLDVIDGGGGADVISGGPGADQLTGGPGEDQVTYADAAGPVTAGLADQEAPVDGDGSSDELAGVEQLRGSSHDDVLTGSANADALTGGAGSDQLRGLGGADTLRPGPGADSVDGGDGADTLDYSQDTGHGAIVDLAAGEASDDGYGAKDALTGVENATGPPKEGNRIAGDDGPNRLSGNGPGAEVRGRGGDDWLDVGLLFGGPGNDRLGTGEWRFSEASGPIRIEPGYQVVDDGDGGHDVPAEPYLYPTVVGSPFGDWISGVYRVTAGAGADFVTGAFVADGGPGDDEIHGTDEPDGRLEGGSGNDRVFGEGGRDVLMIRDGESDYADCGPNDDDWLDYVQADQEALDTVTGCEVVDRAEATPTPTASPTASPSAEPTPEPSPNASPSPEPTSPPGPSPTASPSPSASPSPAPSPTPSPSPDPTPWPEATPDPTSTSAPSTPPSPDPAPSPESTPSASPTGEPFASASPVPSATPAPASKPLRLRAHLVDGDPRRVRIRCNRRCLAGVTVHRRGRKRVLASAARVLEAGVGWRLRLHPSASAGRHRRLVVEVGALDASGQAAPIKLIGARRR